MEDAAGPVGGTCPVAGLVGEPVEKVADLLPVDAVGGVERPAEPAGEPVVRVGGLVEGADVTHFEFEPVVAGEVELEGEVPPREGAGGTGPDGASGEGDEGEGHRCSCRVAVAATARTPTPRAREATPRRMYGQALSG